MAPCESEVQSTLIVVANRLLLGDSKGLLSLSRPPERLPKPYQSFICTNILKQTNKKKKPYHSVLIIKRRDLRSAQCSYHAQKQWEIHRLQKSNLD